LNHPAVPRIAKWLNFVAAASLIGLIFLCLAWEMHLAPLRPGGSWLVLKAAPLLVALFGILHGRRYTFQWASMMILIYVIEGTVRAMSEHGLPAMLASSEAVLASIFFASTVLYVRLTRPARQAA
jgi:uncharacterized membrane protein